MERFTLSFINNSQLLAIVSRQFWKERKRVSCSVRGDGGAEYDCSACKSQREGFRVLDIEFALRSRLNIDIIAETTSKGNNLSSLVLEYLFISKIRCCKDPGWDFHVMFCIVTVLNAFTYFLSCNASLRINQITIPILYKLRLREFRYFAQYLRGNQRVQGSSRCV